MYIEVGKKYGWITVLKDLGVTSHYEHVYRCRCICGKEFTRKDSCIQMSLKRGNTISCGCARKKSKKSPTKVLTYPPTK